MQKLLKNLRLGKKPSEEDLEDYLKTYHDQSPGMTIDRITKYPTVAGCISYELLVREIDLLPAPPQLIVDLACGNGPLTKICLEKMAKGGKVIGVDISKGELEEARKTIQSKQVTFLCERAQCLSLPGGSVDVVLCHLALMLMKPIEPVIQEVARILKPGGLFAGIILIPPKEETVAHKFYEIVGWFLKEQFSDLLNEGIGDPRVKTKVGLQSLLPQSDWVSNLKMEDHEFLMDDMPKNLWKNLQGFYLPRLLLVKDQQKLGEKILEFFNQNINPQGNVSFRLPFRLFSVKRKIYAKEKA